MNLGNFLRPVDYGDASIKMGPPDDSLAVILVGQEPDARIRWYAEEGFARRPSYMGNPLHGIPGLRRGGERTPPPVGTWELVPLEPRFIEDYGSGFPQEFAFDKLAFRTGWGDRDHYLMVEGVGNK